MDDVIVDAAQLDAWRTTDAPQWHEYVGRRNDVSKTTIYAPKEDRGLHRPEADTAGLSDSIAEISRRLSTDMVEDIRADGAHKDLC